METTIHYLQQTPWADFYLRDCLADFCVFASEAFEEAAGFNTISPRKVYQSVGRVSRMELEVGQQFSDEM